MDWISWSRNWSTRSTMTSSRRSLRRRRKYWHLQADPRLKQNQEDLELLAHLPGLFLFLKEHGFILNQELNSIKLTQWEKSKHSSSTRRTRRRRWCDRILETERWSSEKIWVLPNIGLMTYGRARWQEAEATRKDFNTVLTRQDKKFFTSELFKVIQDPIPLILHYWTMSWFRTISSSTLIILDERSIHTPSQNHGWQLEDKIRAGTDWRYSLQPWIPCIRITKIQ